MSPGCRYVDRNTTYSADSNPNWGSVLEPILGSSGVLATFPQISSPVFSGASYDFFAGIHIKEIMVSVTVTGSVGTALASGDIYNQLRFIMFTTDLVYSISPTIPLEAAVNSWPNNIDVKKVLLDLKYDLPTITFEPSTRYNAPSIRTYRAMIPINKVYDCVTTSNIGISGWDTKNGNICFAVVSDSTISPHPTLEASWRVFYDIVNK